MQRAARSEARPLTADQRLPAGTLRRLMAFMRAYETGNAFTHNVKFRTLDHQEVRDPGALLVIE